MNRTDLLSKAVTECMKELYSLAQPSINWEEFKKECNIYSDNFIIWEDYHKAYCNKDKNPDKWEKEKSKHPYWENKSITECIGPKPFEFYYLPRNIFKNVVESYEYAYDLDKHKGLLDTIEILKNYCKDPIVDKYIKDYTDENGNYIPGHRSYDHPDNLEKQLIDLIPDSGFDKSAIAESVQNKFFEFLDMAGKFYNWNHDLNSFKMSVYLGPSPNTDKDAVIANWKKYRKQEIKINEEIYNCYDDECNI